MDAPTVERQWVEPGVVRASYWHRTEDGRVQCDLCPRACTLRDGQRAFCFVREARGGEIVLTSYGRASGFCIDPIEKKPLNHFYAGSSVLSFGTAGCNLGCRFCQNWDISKATETDRLGAWASPSAIAEAAVREGCRSLAFTYNDPVIFAEYAIDCAQQARSRGVKTVAVTAGYIRPAARGDFFAAMDAANVDLKAFTDRFYHKLCFAHLAPVLETLEWIRRETTVWLEITTLLIPGENDSDEEIQELSDWIAHRLGPDVPLHFSAFHPDFELLDRSATPPSTLTRAREIAKRAGLHHVYTGNVHDPKGQSTYCAGCGELVIGRDGYDIGAWKIDPAGRCRFCHATVPGRFDPRPGEWGSRRKSVAFPAAPALAPTR